jgi:hypothetical protein
MGMCAPLYAFAILANLWFFPAFWMREALFWNVYMPAVAVCSLSSLSLRRFV